MTKNKLENMRKRPSKKTIRLALIWIERKLESNGAKLDTAVKMQLEKELKLYIKASAKQLGAGALISTFSTFIDKVRGDKSLRIIFNECGLMKYVTEFSMTINPEVCILRDGKASSQQVLIGYNEATGKIEYGTSVVTYVSRTYFV